MKIAISYFYQIRNFKPYMIPFSTAMWDPKWFHDNEDQLYTFKDRRGVYNGLRLNALVPGHELSDLCREPYNCDSDPNCCGFLQRYREQLNKIDFDSFLSEVSDIVEEIREDEGFDEEPIAVFIVYEKPDNECSERRVIQQWFRSHGMECPELEYSI